MKLDDNLQYFDDYFSLNIEADKDEIKNLKRKLLKYHD